MKLFLIGATVLVLAVVAVALVLRPTQTTPMNAKADSIYDFKAKTIDGKEVKLDKYKGKVLLVVNVASKCGNTPQYAPLEKMYQEYSDKGLVVLGFPCNQFAGQEPGTNEEIKEFCTATYGVKFPMFSKIDVKGENADPLYQWLVAQTDNHNDIEWNFAKFLIGRDGKVIARYSPKTQPDSDEVMGAVTKALAE